MVFPIFCCALAELQRCFTLHLCNICRKLKLVVAIQEVFKNDFFFFFQFH